MWRWGRAGGPDSETLVCLCLEFRSVVVQYAVYCIVCFYTVYCEVLEDAGCLGGDGGPVGVRHGEQVQGGIATGLGEQ